MTTKNAFRRGFTLIELMIVIVILGILMGTILPRLTGAQSRARDTARIADLNNISQALEVYFSDNGEYPPAVCAGAAGANCLQADECDVAGDTYYKLKSYLKGDRVPQNVGTLTNTMGCVGSYYYTPLYKGGSSQTSYVLASDLETWQMANYMTADGTAADGVAPDEFKHDAAIDAGTYITQIGKLANEPADTNTTPELMSIYIVIP